MRRSNPRTRLTVSRHPLRALLAFAALLLLVALPAHAQDPPPVDPLIEVVLREAAVERGVQGDVLWTKSVPWSQLVADGALDTNVNFRDANGDQRTDQSVSLGRLFSALGIPTTTWSDISVARAEGGATTVTSEAMLADGGRTASIFKDRDNQIKLVRAVSRYEASAPEIATEIDGQLKITLTQAQKVTAAPPEAHVGATIAFSATLPPGVDPARTTYEWEFNDGGELLRTDRAVVSHTFKTAGTYNVLATFIVDGSRWTQELPPYVTVEIKRRESDELEQGEVPHPGGSDRGTRRNARRNARSARGTSPDETDATDDTTAPVTPPTGGYDPPADDGYEPPAATSTPITPTPAPTAPAPKPKPRPKPKPDPVRRAPQETAPQGDVVDGYLLASAGAPLPVPSAAALAAMADRPTEQASKPLHVPVAVWVLAGLAALVMLGWGLESRTTLPYFKP